jgi:hypothetical protein
MKMLASLPWRFYIILLSLIICLGTTEVQTIKSEAANKTCTISSDVEIGEACIWYHYVMNSILCLRQHGAESIMPFNDFRRAWSFRCMMEGMSINMANLHKK